MTESVIRDPEGGGNQSGLRDHNARLVLSLIRRHGQLPSADIARRSGLSAQTVSNIIRALESEGLLKRGKAIRGKVGKPSVPMALSPTGVLSLGLNIGRRSAELVLIDFGGNRITGRTTTYAYPEIEQVFAFLKEGIADISNDNPNAWSRVTGIGVARPNKIWNWLEIVGAPASALRAWQGLDLEHAIASQTGLDVIIENDATSACIAEHLQGRGSEFSDFAYLFVGAFIGGGLVLNNKVVSGNGLGAAALGPLPVPDGKGRTTQLLNVASLHLLGRAIEDAGGDPRLMRQLDDWSQFETLVAPWIEKTGANLAIACAAIASIVEVEAVLIDGAMPASIRERLTARIIQELPGLDLTGLEMPKIEEAAIGKGARSIGAALLPIHARYFLA